MLKVKISYPVILTPDEKGYIVYIPDFDANTQGEDLTDAVRMARDAIGLMGIDMEDDKKPLPIPSDVKNIKSKKDDIVVLVDVDFSEYRKKMN